MENINISGDYFKLSLEAGWLAKISRPGQFIEMKVSNGIGSLLRKPFGIHRIIKDQVIEVVYEVVGTGTEILSKKKTGKMLDIIGPLGNGFNCSSPVRRFASLPALPAGRPVLVAGGIGVAPLVYLAQKLARQKPLILLGAKTKNIILCEKEFRDLGCEVKIATDDGSRGYKGFATDLFKSLLANWPTGQPATIYACGPKPMLKATAGIAARHKIPCQALLEEYMACGLGVCLGCPVKTRDGYKMVCKDGPVFEASEVIWE